MLAVYITQKSFGYFDFEVKGVLLDKGDLVSRTLYRTGFYLHVFCGSVALIVGPLQFFALIRNNYPLMHRIAGYTYTICCWIGCVSGFYLSFFTYGSMPAMLGFITLAVMWGFCTSMGFLKIKARDFEQHQHWMMRSFALTFAAVMLRVWIGLLVGALNLDYATVYDVSAWLSWVPNLLVAEIMIRKMHKRGKKYLPSD